MLKLCEFVYLSILLSVWKKLFLVSSSPLVLRGFFASSSVPFPDPRGEEFDGNISFRADYSKVSHSLHNVWLWVSVFVPICCRRKIACWWLSKALMYVFSRMPLVVISLLCFFSRTVTFGFSPDLWSQVLGHPSSIGCRFHLMVWTLNSISYRLVTSTSFSLPIHQSIFQASHYCRSKALYLGWCLPFSSGCVQSNFQ